MQINAVMTRDIRLANPSQSIREAATVMAEMDIGVLPVGDNDRLIGMITDRDIAVRGVALGKGPETKIADVMSEEVKYCFENDDVEAVLENLGDIQLRRLPVLSKEKRLVGIVSIGDLAESVENGAAGPALAEISRPGGAHSQS